MSRDEAKWVLELVRDRYSSIDIDRYSLTDAETDAINMAIKALEHLDNIEAYMHDFDVTEEEAIKALERKRGEWLEKNVTQDRRDAKIPEWQSAKCSVCGKYHTTPYMYYFTNYGYCPNCGSRMKEVEDER